MLDFKVHYKKLRVSLPRILEIGAMIVLTVSILIGLILQPFFRLMRLKGPLFMEDRVLIIDFKFKRWFTPIDNREALIALMVIVIGVMTVFWVHA